MTGEAVVQPAAAEAGPTGVGLGVAFDWALGAQLVSGAVLIVGFGASSAASAVGTIIGSAIAAGACIFVGESLRQGRQWAWWVQVVLGFGVIVGALVLDIPEGVRQFSHHNYWAWYPAAIELLLGPYMAYRLLQPRTRQWFATVSAATAAARHGSVAWLAGVAASAAIGGTLVALARFFE